MGSLGQLLREPPGSIRSRAKPSFAHAHVLLKHIWHTRVASCRTAVLGCIEVPPSSSRLTAAFAPQLLLPTRLAVTVTFDLPPLLSACCPSCISHASELVSSTRPLLCRYRARLLPHPRAWATSRVTAHSGLLASARVSHLLRSHASCTLLLSRGRSHPVYPCRNRTLPHRFSSARVPPRRELRSSAA
jgi:hypothetical protein